MNNLLLFIAPVSAAVPVVIGGLVGGAGRTATGRRWLAASMAYCVAYNFSLAIPSALGFHLGHWNWLGKFAGITTSLVAVQASGLTHEEVGMRFPASPGWPRAAAAGIAALATLSALERLFLDPTMRPYRFETLAFQATMPGLDEELAYRGVLLALLLRALPRGRGGFVAAVTVTFSFWAVHSIAAGRDGVSFTGLKFDTAAAAVGFVWLRLRTRSVAVPMIAHCLDNTINTVVRGMLA